MFTCGKTHIKFTFECAVQQHSVHSVLCDHHHHHLQNVPSSQTDTLSPLNPVGPVCRDLPAPGPPVSGTTQLWALRVSLTSCRMLAPGFVPLWQGTAAPVSKAESHFVARVPRISRTPAPPEGHRRWACPLAVVSSAVVAVAVQTSLPGLSSIPFLIHSFIFGYNPEAGLLDHVAFPRLSF